MPKSGDVDEEIGDEGSADFGGDRSPSEDNEKEPKKRLPRADDTVEEAPPTSHIQHNQGPGPSKEYGTSVPVEGKRNEGPTDFNHPASIEPQRIIWIPQDPLGLGDLETRDLNGKGVEASTENAFMDAKGHVDITGHPPGSDPNTIFG
jgi:calcium permeable stress-gated cation channel